MYVWVNSCTLLCLDQPVYLYLCLYLCTCACVSFENRAPARSRQSAATGDAGIGSNLVRPVPRSALGIVIFVRLSSLVRVRVRVHPCVSIGTTERRVQDDDDDDDDGVTDEAGVGAVDTGIVTAGWDSRVVVVIVVVVVVDARGRERTRGETKSGARAPTRRRRRTKGAARAEKDARGES